MSREAEEAVTLEAGHVADRFVGTLKARGYEEGAAGNLSRGQYALAARNGTVAVTWLELTEGDNRALKVAVGQIRRRAQERGLLGPRAVPAPTAPPASVSADPQPAPAPRQKRKYTRRAKPAKKSGRRRNQAPRTKATIAEYRTRLDSELATARAAVAALEQKLAVLTEIEALL